MHSLVSTYESSITKSASKRYKQDILLQPNKISTLESPFFVNPNCYQWLDELQAREKTIQYLLDHELTDMLSPIHNWPTLDLPSNELNRRLRIFKRKALLLLYALADSAAGPAYTILETRKRQACFLEGLTIQNLAMLGCIIEVMGQGYWNIIKNGLAEMEYKDSLLGVKVVERPTSLFIPRSIKYNKARM